jgi:adenosylhomocysteinase
MRVRELHAALPEASVVITVTGSRGVIGADEIALMRDDTLLANAGHFSEIEASALGPGQRLTEHVSRHGRIRVLGRGEMLNLTAATGNQIQVMDLGFALQAHSLRELARDPSPFAPGPQPVPPAVDDVVARAMLAALSG